MARAALVSRLRPEFDDFLYASIGQHHEGMPLSVLSLIARNELDPWNEAAELATLPEAEATQRLATLISALPAELLEDRDPSAISKELIALLPGRVTAAAPWRSLVDLKEPSTSTALRYGMVMGALLSGQLMVTSCHPPAPADGASPPAAGTSSQTLPPRSQQ
jgi:hypothetical protein